MINKGIKCSCGPQAGLFIKKRQEPIKPLRPEIFAKPSSLALFRIRDAGTHEYKFSYQVQ